MRQGRSKLFKSAGDGCGLFPSMGTRTASPRGRYGERPQRDSCLKIHM